MVEYHTRRIVVILITGATSGIGKELAIIYANKGYNLILLSKDEEKLKKFQQEILMSYRISCEIIQYNLNKTKGIENLVEEIPADIVINCAGIGEYGDFETLSVEREMEIFKVNFISPMIISKLFANKFLKAGKGTVVNICSTSAFYYHPYLTAYGASKSSLVYYSLSLNEEVSWKNKNVKIVTICPGPTDTSFFKKEVKEKYSAYKFLEMKPDKVAKEIFEILYSNKTFAIIGLRNKIFTKLAKILPLSIQLYLTGNFLRKGALK